MVLLYIITLIVLEACMQCVKFSESFLVKKDEVFVLQPRKLRVNYFSYKNTKEEINMACESIGIPPIWWVMVESFFGGEVDLSGF